MQTKQFFCTGTRVFVNSEMPVISNPLFHLSQPFNTKYIMLRLSIRVTKFIIGELNESILSVSIVKYFLLFKFPTKKNYYLYKIIIYVENKLFKNI